MATNKVYNITTDVTFTPTGQASFFTDTTDGKHYGNINYQHNSVAFNTSKGRTVINGLTKAGTHIQAPNARINGFGISSTDLIVDVNIELYDESNNRWRIDSQRARFSKPYKISIPLAGITVTDSKTENGTTTYYATYAAGITINVYEPYPMPGSGETYFPDIAFDSLVTDTDHEGSWKTNIANNQGYWMLADDMVIQWQNYDPDYTGSGNGSGTKYYPDMDLFWVIVPENDPDPDAQTIIRYSQAAKRGIRSYFDYLDNGQLYSSGANTSDTGFVQIHMDHIYTQNGTHLHTFSGKGKIYFVMGIVHSITGEILWTSDIKSYPLWRERVALSGTLAVDAISTGKHEINVSLSDPFEGKLPSSPVIVSYSYDNTNWNDINGHALQFTISRDGQGNVLQANSSQTLYFRLQYMNKTGPDEQTCGPKTATLYPESATPTVTLVPVLSGSDLTYTMTITANTSGNESSDNLNYAIFAIPDYQADFTTTDLDSEALNASYHTGANDEFLVTDPSKVFSGLSESDVENNIWVVLVHNTENGLRDWAYINNSMETITGQYDNSPKSSATVQVPVVDEYSNRMVKELVINRLSAGKAIFQPSKSISRSYSKNKAIQSISLMVEDYIPVEFSGQREEYITYYLTINSVRYPITPVNKSGNHPQVYHINISVSDYVRTEQERQQVKYIYPGGVVKEFQIEADINGDPNYTYRTPVLYGWRVSATTI